MDLTHYICNDKGLKNIIRLRCDRCGYPFKMYCKDHKKIEMIKENEMEDLIQVNEKG